MRRPAPTLNPGAHPRSRGENTGGMGWSLFGWGSSPLTRGKRAGVWGGTEIRGLIPAHAGKTDLRCVQGRRRRAHPRSRGENPSVLPGPSSMSGSSPLTRGKPAQDCGFARSLRLIPAHAGKTQCLWSRQSRVGAHPRSRGENQVCDYDGYCSRGSSPLTRGKPVCWCVRCLRIGLIPAHAGKTTCTQFPSLPGRAHPRSRGENSISRRSRARMRGSSPLTRGKHHLRK